MLMIQSTGHATPLDLALLQFRPEHERHQRFVELVESALERGIQELVKFKNLYAQHDENALNSTLVYGLRSMGFTAGFDTNVGGHCDIVIEALGNLLWLGEAKIFTGVEWVAKGFHQLTSRYATSIDTHGHGGLVLYIRKGQTSKRAEAWRLHVTGELGSTLYCENGNFSFTTLTVIPATGATYKVRHFLISLQHEPAS